MATKTIKVCDAAEGGEHEAKPTPYVVTFSGQRWELDLCQRHEDSLRECLAGAVQTGRQVGRRQVIDLDGPRRERGRRPGIAAFNREHQIDPTWSGGGRPPKVVEEAYDRHRAATPPALAGQPQ